ncbi:MAG: hypothetical protein IPL26_06965 [Leptospiraceae bacterium]|nr:hypothetical protein [Leptospiraceae bacterium]
MSSNDTFWTLVKESLKSPFADTPDYPKLKYLKQSTAAFAINIWFLVIAVLAQFYVFLSAILLGIQAYNAYLVYKGERDKFSALFIGLILVLINYGALTLAVLGQFWVIGSTILATWQYISLWRLCFSK